MTEARKIYKDFERITRNNYGTIIFEQGENEPHEAFSAVRAGLTWPTQSPGYFVLLGQRVARNTRGRNPLNFIVEGESADPVELFRLLCDEAMRFYCEDVYVDLSEGWKGFEDLFTDFLAANKIEGIYFKDAPYRQKFELGLAIIRKWISENALTIDAGTLLSEQLGRLPRGDLAERPEIHWYAVNALRYVVGSFEQTGGSRMTPEEVRRLERLHWRPA